MGRIPGKEGNLPAQPLTYMWERHREIMRRLVAGEPQGEIALSIGMSVSRMSIICNSPAFKSELQRLSEGADREARDVQGRIQDMSIDSMAVLEGILTADVETTKVTHKLQVEVSKDMLDRAGHGAVKKTASLKLDGTLTADDIEEMKANAAKVVNAQ